MKAPARVSPVDLAPLGEPSSSSGREAQQDALEAEPANLRRLRSPNLPTLEEIEEHEDNGHCPPRPWCPACVAGYGKSDQHRRLHDEESKAVPTISADYCYMGMTPEEELRISASGGHSAMPILVSKGHKDRWVG